MSTKSHKIILSTIASVALFYSGCGTKNQALDKNITKEINATVLDQNQTITTPKPIHIPSFEISKDTNSELIFKQLSKLDGKTYIIKENSDFKALYNSNSIKNFEDVVEFIELHGYTVSKKEQKSYSIIELQKEDSTLQKKLKNTKVSIKGSIPLSVAVSEVGAKLGLGYTFDKSLATTMSRIHHFYYSGNAKDALSHIAQKAEVEIDFEENQIVLQKYATAFVSVDLPLKNRSLATNIINNISSTTTNSASTTSSNGSSATGATASDDGFDSTIVGSDKQSIVEAYNQFIIKELVVAIKSTLTKDGSFHYIPTSGQIMLKDKAENVKDAVKLINNFNDKFKEKIEIEFKFYKLTTNEIKNRGINITGMLNDKIAVAFSPYTQASAATVGTFGATFNDGTTNAVLNILNQFGKTEVENTVTMYNQSNIINVEKITSNYGYIESVETTTDTNNNVTNEVTPGSVPDGTFFAVLANTMSGKDVGINYFLSFNNLRNFLTHTTSTTAIQTPNTAEQSYSNTKVVQSGIPYVISAYKIKSNSTDKKSLPFIEDTFLDTVTGTKDTAADDKYIIVTMKATKRL